LNNFNGVAYIIAREIEVRHNSIISGQVDRAGFLLNIRALSYCVQAMWVDLSAVPLQVLACYLRDHDLGGSSIVRTMLFVGTVLSQKESLFGGQSPIGSQYSQHVLQDS